MNDVQKIADLFSRVSLESGSNDPFWIIKTKECLSILIRVTLYQPKEYRTMANVLYLLNILMTDPEMIDYLIVRSHDERLLLDHKSLTAQSEKVLQSVLSSAKAALQIFDDEEVAKVTSYHSFSFEELRNKPTVVFLHNSIANQPYYSVLNSIVFQQFYEFILEDLPKKGDLEIFVILEELSSLNLGKLLPLALANCRKYSVGTICALQNQKQLEPYYGKDADNIINNCITKIYMPGITSLDTLRELETISGKFTYKDKKDVEKTRPLITIDEARQLKDRTLILHSKFPIIKGRLQPYYKNRNYKQFCKMSPMVICNNLPDEPVSLIPDPRKEVIA